MSFPKTIGLLLLFFALLGNQISYAQLTSNFSSDVTEGCSPLTVQFQDNSSNTTAGLRYLWSFGNGNVSTKQNPQAIFYQPGKYEISLEITDSSGKKHQKVVKEYITVFKNPIARLSGSQKSGCAPLPVSYTNNSQLGDAPLSFTQWDFGDGNTTTSDNPTHTYLTDGKFNVSLHVIDENGCEDEISENNLVSIKRLPIVEFSSSRQTNCVAPFEVNFKDESRKTRDKDTYLWDFGDGNTSTDENPTHTYTKEGNFRVTLTITTPEGCKAFKSLASYIFIGDLKPTFTADQTEICAPTKVILTNTTSPAGLVSRWEFGDGGFANGNTVEYEFKSTGQFDVKLIVTQSDECKAEETKPGFITVIDKPVAEFTHSDTVSCQVPFTLIATNTSKNITTTKWYSKGSEVAQTLTHAEFYNAAGTYVFSLEVENSFGCKDEKEITVRLEPLELSLSADTLEGCKELTVDFRDATDYTEDAVESKSWDIGDGTTYNSLDSAHTHVYKDTGEYVMTLTVTTEKGCVSNASLTIKVGQKTNPTFIVPQDSFCNQDVFLAASTVSLTGPPEIDKLTWHVYSDEAPFKGDSLKKEAPFDGDHEFDENYRDTLKKETGWYNVAYVTENNGCADTSILNDAFFVHDPIALIEIESFDPCTDENVSFVDISEGGDSIIWFITTSKGGSFTSEQNRVTINKEKHGDSHLMLYAYNFESGCVDFVEDSVSFPPGFDVEVSESGDRCAPANLNFSYTITEDSTGGAQEYQATWSVDNAIQGETTSLFSQFENPGEYTVLLTVVQQLTGCIDTASINVEITGPAVEAEINYDKSCPPIALDLTTNMDPSDYDSLYWELEDRIVMVTSAGTVSDTLFMPGQDSASESIVRLVGIDSNGCRGTKSFPVVSEGPSSAFIKLRRLGSCEGLNYIFNGEIPGLNEEDYTFSWDLGNGKTSQSRIINVTYEKEGVYDVKLTIAEKNGCTSTFTKVLDIEKEKLFTDFEADSIKTACPPLFVSFKNKSSAPNRPIASYFWDFGDGSTSIEGNPSKLYLKAGKFTVKLYTIDEWGCEDSVIYDDFVVVNGPEGNYDFDEKEGCAPLTVNFTSTTQRTEYYEWDMGDGTVIENTSSYIHVYNDPGRYIPLLILSDTLGCSYTIPPIDTIYVYPYPQSDYTYDGTCVNYPIRFSALDDEVYLDNTYIWEMITSNGIDTLYGEDIEYTFYDIENPEVRLTTISSKGCISATAKTLDLYKLKVNFASKSLENCVGTTITLENLTISDTTIINTKWIIEGEEFYDLEPSFFASKVGPVNITLIQENILGCIDTLSAQTVVIGDSTIPRDPETLRVTVNDNQTIQVDYKMSTLLDFKSYIIYREDNIGEFIQQAEITDLDQTSFLSYGNNTIGQSYCYKLEVRNTCGLLSDTLTDFKHCTIETKAQGDTNRNLVSWSRYIGWDSVETYAIYREELDATSVIQQIGKVTGGNYSYIDSTVYCNIEYSYIIEGEEFEGNNQLSWSDTANAQPVWYNTPPPNKLVRATVEDDLEILIEWDSVSNSQIPIAKYVLEKSLNGRDYTKLIETEDDIFEFIDAEVLVDDRSYYYQTYAVDECNDTTEAWNYGKTILLDADTSADQRPELNWSHYEGWTETIAYYAVEIKNEDNSFTEIATFIDKGTNYRDLITDLNQRPDYCYRIVAYKDLVQGEPQVVSVSNEDCSPVRSMIFYPNAFTPNNDGLNDYYVTPSQYIKDYHIMIFTRWGEQIFESFDLNENWDGTYRGENSKMDAFAVIVVSTGVDGIRRVHHGTITLVR